MEACLGFGVGDEGGGEKEARLKKRGERSESETNQHGDSRGG